MYPKFLAILFLAVFLLTVSAAAQTTAFSYQGKLTDGLTAASGTYDLQFALFDADIGGTQIGSTVTGTGIQASGGIFTVQLDFGASPFASGTNRYLEISVKHPADSAYTMLTPRQRLGSAPFAIKSLSATSAASAGNVTGVVAVANGGTGSTVKNFVDLSSNQATIGGNKSFTGSVGLGGTAVAGLPLTVYDSTGSPAMQTTSTGIRIGDVNGNGFGNYLDIDFESSPIFKFVGAEMNTGNIKTTGSVQIPAVSDFQYANAKTHYDSVSSTAFNPESAIYERAMISGNLYLSTGTSTVVGYLVAPVNLPDGATVTSVAFYVVDNDGTYNLQPGQLWRNDASASTSYGNSTLMATTPLPSSTNSTLIQLTSTGSISSPVIDNQNYQYYLRWGTQQANSNLRLVRVLITYTVTKAD